MDRRQVIALLSLGVVGAGVGGIAVATGRDDDAPTAGSGGDEAEGSTIDQADAAGQASDDAAPIADADVPDLPNRGPHPEFLPVRQWLQTDTPDFAAFDGKVRAVQFWTFGCHNCQATWPHMRDLHAKYAGDDFEIIGVHAPEFDFEDDIDAVQQAATDNGLVWPIAVEFKETKANFRSWQDRRFWPRLFLIDVDGNVRYDKIGEGRYDEIDAAVGALIAEKNA
ncbi:MAG: redoxin family protein [Ilumatobacter sp.]